MAHFLVNDPVDVRGDKTHVWRAGTVTAVTGDRYTVTLGTPITSDTWTGTTRRYGGSDNITKVNVLKTAEVVVEGELIRVQGG